MNATNETCRAFIHFGRAWYARYNNHLDGMIDTVNFGDWHTDGSGNSAAMTWYAQGPRLEVFSDAWECLAGMPDLIATLGNMNNYNVTPLEFCELLLALGFEDRTPADAHSNVVASLGAAPSGITQRIVSMEDLGLLLDVTPIEPLFSIGERLFYFAPWGDKLAAQLGEGWYVGEVSEPYEDAARVGFVVQDGKIIEQTITAARLRTKLPEGARAQNADMRTIGEACYYHTSDYGWLMVTITSLDDGMAGIEARNRDELLIGGRYNLAPLAELKDALPDGILAFNQPILGERENGNPDWLICPNCEHGQHDDQPYTTDLNNLHTCTNCRFNFIRPARQEGTNHAM